MQAFNEYRTRSSDFLALPNIEDIKNILSKKFPDIRENGLFEDIKYWPYLMIRVKDDKVVVFDAVKPEYTEAEDIPVEVFLDFVLPGYVINRKNTPRKKGTPQRKRTVSKAVITFVGGETYTIKGFNAVNYTAGKSLTFYTLVVQGDTYQQFKDIYDFDVEDIETVGVSGPNNSFTIDYISDFNARISGPSMDLNLTGFTFEV